MSALPQIATTKATSLKTHVCFDLKSGRVQRTRLCRLRARSGLRGAAKNSRRPLPSAQKAHEVAELLHRRALYCVYAELRVLLTNLDGRMKRWGIECCLRLLKVFKSEQDYALGWLAFD
jgi:hypothetical protein